MKQRRIPIHCRTCVYTVSYNAGLNSIAVTRVTNRQHENLDAQQLQIKYLYEQVHETPARRVRNDRKLPMGDEAEDTMSGHLCSDVKQCQPTTSRIERDEELPS